ncbi:hypothetical protein [Anaerosalibacter sp. Marseille-P3206]|uniref:hypothetical protein n=1 Tax=Anaerosalibacter sp. Marseille-P3206 TaxID=1871005 RepID=UPI0009850848|nr:hypothetical protein [Anaerosalibacter sp. Marseille-P3206]
MNKIIRNGNIVINSEGYYYNFYKDEQENLNMVKFNNNGLLVDSIVLEYKKVLNFSVNIDKEDTIHLICLLKNGNLVYSTFKNEEWSNNYIGNLDTKSNIYKQLYIYIINNEIYTFYAYCNLVNKNICTLELITGTNVNWTRKRIINIVTNDFDNPFSINHDSLGNIHFAYKSQEKNHSHIYYVFYNIYTQSWSKTPMKISNAPVENANPYLFVDTKDNVHILWYSLENMDFILHYKRLAASGQDKYRWVEVKLPLIKNIDTPTIMFEIDNILKITYFDNNSLGFLSSKDQGLTWVDNNKLKLDTESIFFIKCSSNYSKTHFLEKASDCYCQIGDEILCYLYDSSNKKDITNSKKNVSTSNVDTQSPSNISKVEEELKNLKRNVEELLLYKDKTDNEISKLKDSFEQNKNISFLNKLSSLFKSNN